MNVLMVDDQPAKLLSCEAILGGMGERLITADSASEVDCSDLTGEVRIQAVKASAGFAAYTGGRTTDGTPYRKCVFWLNWLGHG